MVKKLQAKIILTIMFSVSAMLATGNNEPDKLWDSDDLYVSNIYPNPAVHSITLDYRILDNNTNATIIFRNVLGSEMGIYNLSQRETSLTIQLSDFSSGVYFYTLSVEGKDLVTKKFMVSR